MREPVAYIERTRDWYSALGYDTPYIWADNRAEEIPFAPLAKPLSAAHVSIITTAALYDPAKGDQGPGAAYNGAAKFFAPYRHPISDSVETRISHIAYDRQHTSAQDQRTWFPLEALLAAQHAGRIQSTGGYFYGAPTNRSQRVTREVDAPALLSMLADDAVDAAVLIPNCPVCHQTVTLIARHLERNGIATVILGCAKDIVETAGAPRFVFSDFPLGNGAGKPGDPASQAETLALGLSLLETATAPVTVENSQIWSESSAWKEDYSNPAKLTPDELSARRKAFDAQKDAAKNERSASHNFPSASATRI